MAAEQPDTSTLEKIFATLPFASLSPQNDSREYPVEISPGMSKIRAAGAKVYDDSVVVVDEEGNVFVITTDDILYVLRPSPDDRSDPEGRGRQAELEIAGKFALYDIEMSYHLGTYMLACEPSGARLLVRNSKYEDFEVWLAPPSDW